MENTKRMTASMEDYLKAIYFLHKQDECIRLIDIADRMAVSKPSAHNAVLQLSDMGLVEHPKFGPIRLTIQGSELAKSLVSKHEVIKLFLMQTLDISEKLAIFEACVMEHSICDITLAKMSQLV